MLYGGGCDGSPTPTTPPANGRFNKSWLVRIAVGRLGKSAAMVAAGMPNPLMNSGEHPDVHAGSQKPPQPVRRKHGSTTRSESLVLIVRVAHECVVAVVDLPVRPGAEEVAVIRIREVARQPARRRHVRLKRDDAGLARVLVVAEEEEAILDDRAAEPDSGIAAREMRVGVERIPPQRRISGHAV